MTIGKGASGRFALRPSASLLDAIAGLRISGWVLDAACGYGRNARLLAECGLRVVCVDRDEKALRSLGDRRYRLWLPTKRRRLVSSPGRGQVVPVRSDLLAEGLPFASGSFSFIVNVHFTAPVIFGEFARVLKPGGYLFVETVGAQGGNYKELPAPGELRRRLAGAFELVRYVERAVRSPGTNAVTVKLLAVRKAA